MSTIDSLPTAAALLCFLHVTSPELCAMELCHWYATTTAAEWMRFWKRGSEWHRWGNVLGIDGTMCYPAGYHIHTEEWGVVTVNSPDTGMHGAVKRYTAPFFTASTAQQGHKYQPFTRTPCSTNIQHTLSLPLSIIALLSMTDCPAFLLLITDMLVSKFFLNYYYYY